MPPLLAAVRRTALLSLPFAAILAVGSTSATRVRAQTLAPGWNALPRTGVTNPTATGDYDWTGLNANLALTPFTPDPSSNTPTFSTVAAARGPATNRWMTHSYQGMVAATATRRPNSASPPPEAPNPPITGSGSHPTTRRASLTSSISPFRPCSCWAKATAS